MEKSFIATIGQIVGKDNMEAAPEQLYTYTYDASFACGKHKSRPGLVASPGSTAEVSAILKLCSEYRVPVVPRGAASNLSGGALPVEGCLMLLTNRLNKIVAIDRSNMVARVQPGVITGELQKQVEAVGLFYPPDPASLNFCTIGGNLAECAGGPRGLKYGVTRDYVLGLETVLADGSVLRTGTGTVKGVTGYDLTRLLVGSEGTLGVFTEATLRLIPKPPDQRTILAIYDDVRRAAETVNEILQQGVVPACLEFLDKNFIRCIEAYARIGLPVDSEAVLLVEVDGHPGALDYELATVLRVCRAMGAREVQSASAREERDKLWAARRSAFASISRLRPSILSEDIVVPRNQFAEMVLAAQAIGGKYGLEMAILGHAGDGNLHADILTDENDDRELSRVKQAVEEMLQTALRLGGTITGEHGIGSAKAPYLAWEIDSTGLQVMRQMKQLLDPLGILNPGKFM